MIISARTIKKCLACHFSSIVYITILALSYVFRAHGTSLPSGLSARKTQIPTPFLQQPIASVQRFSSHLFQICHRIYRNYTISWYIVIGIWNDPYRDRRFCLYRTALKRACVAAWENPSHGGIVLFWQNTKIDGNVLFWWFWYYVLF